MGVHRLGSVLGLLQFRVLYLFRADVAQLTFVAMRLARCANIASVQQQPMMSTCQVFGRNMLYQHLLYLKRCVGSTRHQSQAMTHPIHTCVSTGIADWPNATACITLAVLRPTPGKRSNASKSLGTSPSYSSTSIRESSTRCRALALG